MGLAGTGAGVSSGLSGGGCRQPYGLLEQHRRPSSIAQVHNDSTELMSDEEMSQSTVFSLVGRTPPTDELMHDSVKLQVFLCLLRQLRSDGHRTLVFSQSKLMLDIIQRVLSDARIGSYRIDGSVGGRERQSIIDNMNDVDNRIDVCLLTTKACGFGITLTGADRVIVYDPSWNPAEDRQAVDRAYRIGQKKEVIVYRIIMAGSIEEKMYEKQVFKDGLRVVSERGASSRYFSDKETKELFTLDGHGECACMRRLWGYDEGCKIMSCPDMPRGTSLEGVLGYSKHDALYISNIQNEKAGGRDKDKESHSSQQNVKAPSDTEAEKTEAVFEENGHGDESEDDFEETEGRKTCTSRPKASQQKIDSVFKPTSSQPQAIAKPAWPTRKTSSRPLWPARTNSSHQAAPLLIDLTDEPDSPTSTSDSQGNPNNVSGTTPGVEDMSCEELLKDLEKLHIVNKTLPSEKIKSSEFRIESTNPEENENKGIDNVSFNKDASGEKSEENDINAGSGSDGDSDNNIDHQPCNLHLDLKDLHSACDDSDIDDGNIFHEDLSDSLVDSDSDDEAEHSHRRENSRIRLTKTIAIVKELNDDNADTGDSRYRFERNDNLDNEAEEGLSDSEDDTEKPNTNVKSHTRLKKSIPTQRPLLLDDECVQNHNQSSTGKGTNGFVISDSVFDDSESSDDNADGNDDDDTDALVDSEDSEDDDDTDALVDSEDSEDDTERNSRLINNHIRLAKNKTASHLAASPSQVTEKTETTGVTTQYGGKDNEDKSEDNEKNNIFESSCDGKDLKDVEKGTGIWNAVDRPLDTVKSDCPAIASDRHGKVSIFEYDAKDDVRGEADDDDSEHGGSEEEDETCGGFIVPDIIEEDEEDTLKDSDSEDEADFTISLNSRRVAQRVVKPVSEQEDDTHGGFIVPDSDEEEEDLSDSEDDTEYADRFANRRLRRSKSVTKSSIVVSEEDNDEDEDGDVEEEEEDSTCGGFIVPDSEEDNEEDWADSEDDVDRRIINLQSMKKKVSVIHSGDELSGDDDDDDAEEEDDTCGGFIVPDSEEEEEEEEESGLSDSDDEIPLNEQKENNSQFNTLSRPCEVIDLLDSASEEEYSPNKPKSNGRRRRTVLKARSPPPALKPKASAAVAAYVSELKSFTVENISPLSVQRSYQEMKKLAPNLNKFVKHSRKSLNMHQINEYNDLLYSAKRFESKSKWKESATEFVKAIEICDDDKSLHKKLYLLEKIIE